MTPVIKDTQTELDRQAAHATFRAFVSPTGEPLARQSLQRQRRNTVHPC
jgi:hypothetical protein